MLFLLLIIIVFFVTHGKKVIDDFVAICFQHSNSMIISFSKSCHSHLQAGYSVVKNLMLRNNSENQDQPSPISVLEPPFEDDNTSLEASGNMKPDHQGICTLYLCMLGKHSFM